MARLMLLPPRPAAEDAVGPGQGQTRDERGFEGQGAEILGLEVMHIALPASPRQDLDLRRTGVEEVGPWLGGGVHLQPGGQLRVLGGDADRASAGVAVVARIGGGTNLVII